MIKEPLLSVIIPVYGTEKLVPRCLDSILKSSYKNIEIVVVDDKSPAILLKLYHFMRTFILILNLLDIKKIRVYMVPELVGLKQRVVII